MDSAWFLKKYSEECDLNPAGMVIAGISGGPDSMTLLHLLISSHVPCIAVHFDHQLRPESGSEASFVSNYCKDSGTRFILGTGDVRLYSRTRHISLEEGARELRYKFLFDQASFFLAQAVLVGHNKDDQVETILMHLMRGTGTSGLAGMRQVLIPNPWSDLIPLVRPLLDVSRSEILEYCQQHNLKTITDSSNADPHYFRNRIRKELLPQLITYNPTIKDRIHNMGDVINLENDYLNKQINTFWNENQLGLMNGVICLDRENVSSLHPALLRRLVRKMIGHLNRSERNIDLEVVEKAVDFIKTANRSNHIDLFAGIEMFIAFKDTVIMVDRRQNLDELWPQMTTKETIELPIEGEVVISERWKLHIGQATAFSRNTDPFSCSLSIENIKDSLNVRCARPGDRFTPFGMQGKSKKLGDFWTDEGLPGKARRKWPLICMRDEILWVPGFRIAEKYKVEEDSITILNLLMRKIK